MILKGLLLFIALGFLFLLLAAFVVLKIAGKGAKFFTKNNHRSNHLGRMLRSSSDFKIINHRSSKHQHFGHGHYRNKKHSSFSFFSS